MEVQYVEVVFAPRTLFGPAATRRLTGGSAWLWRDFTGDGPRRLSFAPLLAPHLLLQLLIRDVDYVRRGRQITPLRRFNHSR